MKKLTYFCVLFVCIINFGYGQTVKSKTFLQGAYLGSSLMSTTLNPIIPHQQPYDNLPWNYPGNETIDPVPSNMVDWVLVELREAQYPRIIIARKAALLLNNGDVVGVDLSTSINFPNVPPGNYFLCIYHRNHIPVMSANPISVPNIIPYDFSDTLNFPPYGGGAKALIELEPGVFGMIAGDANKDGVLKYSGPNNDRGAILQYILNITGSTNITATVNGYVTEDVIMDSIVRYSGPNNDPSVIIQNLVGLTGSTSITSTFTSVVPVIDTVFECGDTLIDLRDGKSYNSVEIGDYCWMAENLNYGTRIDASQQQTDNGIAEKHCYNDDELYCDTLGALYQWDELMQYSNEVGAQGLCPSGWHIATDSEWKNLEGTVDSLYGVGDTIWDQAGWRGYDAGKNLKSVNRWEAGGNGVDLYDFTAFPAGRSVSSAFGSLGMMTYFWISEEADSLTAWSRYLRYDYDHIRRGHYYKTDGRSVRCVLGPPPCIPLPDQADAGPDTFNILIDSLYLMANIPVNGIGKWNIVSGTGGIVANQAFANTAFYGQQCVTYTLTWTISTLCGISTDTVIISFGEESFSCGDTLTDKRDGKKYLTVEIGDYCWMAENLNYGTRVDVVLDQTNNGIAEKHCYNDDELYCDTLGALYQWDELMQYVSEVGTRGLCPLGWHVATDDEWKNLEGTVDSQYGVGDTIWDQEGWRGFDAGKNLKSTSSWTSSGNGLDLYGFNAYPAGRSVNGGFGSKGLMTYFWISNENDNLTAWSRYLRFDYDHIRRGNFYKTDGRSARCILNPSPCNVQPIDANAGADDTICEGEFFSLTVTVTGGIPPFFYSWNDGSSGIPHTVQPTATTTYAVTITDANSDSDSDEVTIVVNLPPTANAGADVTLCEGECTPLTAAGAGTGGSYAWSNGGTDATINKCPSATSTYTVTVTDANNCTDSDDVVIIVNPVPTANAGADATINSGESYSIGIAATGGTSPYTYAWSNGSTNITQSVNPTTTTTYIVSVTDANSCTDSDEVTITVTVSSMPTANAGEDATICNGDAQSIGLIATGGMPPYIYSWSNGSSSVTQSVSPTTTMTYTVTVTDANNNTDSDEVVITVNHLPTANAGPDQINVCSPTNLEANQAITNETGLWSIISGMGGNIANLSDPHSSFSGSPGHAYTLRWTITNDCGSAYDDVVVSIPSNPTPANAGQDTTEACSPYRLDANDPITGTGVWTIISGTGGYISSSGDPNSHFSGEPGSCYSLEWKIYKACSSRRDTVNVCFSKIADAGLDDTICKGDTTVIENIANGGIPPYIYAWSNGSTDANQQVSPSTKTIYTLSVTDARGCTQTDKVKIVVNPLPIANAGADATISPGGSHTIGYIALGGTFPYTYLWNNNSTQHTITVSPTTTTTYIQYVTDYNGCTDSDSVTITVLVNCQLQTSLGGDKIICIGHSIELVASANSGTLPYYYDWNNNVTNLSQVVSPTSTTYYTVTVTDAMGCTASDDVTVYVVGLPFANAGADAINACSPYTLQGNHPGLDTGLWTILSGIGGNVAIPSEPESDFTGTPGTTYELEWKVTNICGSSADTVVINFAQFPPIAEAGNDQQDLCDSTFLEGNDPSPGKGLWTIHNGGGGRIVDSTLYNSKFFGLRDSVYSLYWTIYDTVCLSYTRDSVNITFLPEPTVPDAGPDQLNVIGTSTTLDANQAVDGDGLWIIAEGTNGQITNPAYEKSIFSGMADSTYILVWQITLCSDTLQDSVKIVLGHDTIVPCPGAPTVTDEDGNIYQTVLIGDQCWMRENLKVGKMIDGHVYGGPDAIMQTNNDTIEKYCYNNSQDSCEIYGAYYTWDEMMGYDTTRGIRGICPYGWHIPTDVEWTRLEDTIAGLYGEVPVAMRETGTRHWMIWPNVNATNSSGFTAFGSGSHGAGVGFWDLLSNADWWTSTPSTEGYIGTSINRGFAVYDSHLERGANYRNEAFSVRCLKNCEPQPSSPDAGPDSLNIVTDSIVLMGNNPQSGTGSWTIVSGKNGSFKDPSSPTSVFYGERGRYYTLRWTISTICFDSIDEVNLRFINPPCPGDTVLNYQGRTYKTVLIGDKCWMAENLNVGTMINDLNDQTDNDTIEKYCYDNLESYCDTFGGLYQWNEMMEYVEDTSARGICPYGWYIPSDQEWKDLQGRVDDLYGVGDPEWDGLGPQGLDVGGNLKDTDTIHWPPPNENATNASGFKALPGGLCIAWGGDNFDDVKEDAYFWTSTRNNTWPLKWARVLSYEYPTIDRDDYSYGFGFSVRCIRDTCQPMPSQAFAGIDSLDIATDTIVLYANTPSSGNGLWTIITGTGGSFSDSTDPGATFYGLRPNSYILRWTITTRCGFDFDEVMISFASASAPPCPGIPTVYYGGQTYNTVLIDSMCWMRENLNIGDMINTGTAQSDNAQIEKYCYGNDPANCNVYGGLYQWSEMMDYVTTVGSQGICPAGWHIPDDDDWDDLVNFLGGSSNAGGKMKETGTIRWEPPNTGATNECGFTALPAGEILAYIHSSANKTKLTRFWSSKSLYGIMAKYRTLEYNKTSISETQGIFESGYSVRCLKDD